MKRQKCIDAKRIEHKTSSNMEHSASGIFGAFSRRPRLRMPGPRCSCFFSLSGSEDRVENEKPKEKNSEPAPAAWFRLARGGLPNLTARQPVEISTRGLNHLWPCHHSFFTARAQLLLQLFLRPDIIRTAYSSPQHFLRLSSPSLVLSSQRSNSRPGHV